MLYLTENLTSSREISRRLNDIEECIVVNIDHIASLPANHSIILCDIELYHSNVSNIKLFVENYRIGKSVPLIYLSHQSGIAALAMAKEIDATAVIHKNISTDQILFFVRRILERRNPNFISPVPPLTSVISTNINYAATVYKQTLEAVRYGKSIDLLALERGSDAIIAAVGGQRMSAWLEVVRAYDNITYQHCLLVASFVVLFAKNLGISIKNQRLISKAALIHDIGKLSIPLEILNKPGKLTDVEMEAIKSHPSIGHELLLRQGGFDKNTLEMVRHHHEYIDGSGYPDGISGNKISNFVRIMTICDIYSALVERRSYKEPMSSGKALDIIKGMSQKLDQDLIAKFDLMINQSD